MELAADSAKEFGRDTVHVPIEALAIDAKMRELILKFVTESEEREFRESLKYIGLAFTGHKPGEEEDSDEEEDSVAEEDPAAKEDPLEEEKKKQPKELQTDIHDRTLNANNPYKVFPSDKRRQAECKFIAIVERQADKAQWPQRAKFRGKSDHFEKLRLAQRFRTSGIH